jgi:ElaB/YqjD/DUF883 family membrane-anchored ribosome-binding protein
MTIESTKEASMAGEKIEFARRTHAERDLQETEEIIDETVDESFPASDPPAWTTSGSMSVAARHGSGTLHEALTPLDQGLNVGAASSAQHIADAASSFARNLYRRGEAYVPERWRHVTATEKFGMDAMRTRIVEHPLAAIAVAGAVGCALGWLLASRSTAPRQWHPVYKPRRTGTQRRYWAGRSRMRRHPENSVDPEAASHTNNSF